MKLTAFTFYLWAQADHIRSLFPWMVGVGIALCLIGIFGWFIARCENCDGSIMRRLAIILKTGIGMFATGLLVMAFMPESKTIAEILNRFRIP